MKLDYLSAFVASYLIFRRDGKIAFVLRENTGYMSGYYGLPAGKLETGENFTDAAIREAKEETGVELQATDITPVLTAHRSAQDSTWVDVIFEVKSWHGDLYNAEPHMHKELAWLDANDLPANVIPEVRYYLEQIEAGNTYAEFGWPTKNAE